MWTAIGMRALFIVFLVSAGNAASASSFSGQRSSDAINGVRQARPPRARQPQRRNDLVRTPPVRDLVQGYYVDRFQQELNLTGEQSNRLLPALRQSLQRRNELAQQRAQALNRLRRVLEENGSEEEIAARTRELDEANVALRNVQQEFLRTADRELTPAQRANLRILLPNLENRIRNLIERSRGTDGAAPGRPND